MEKKNRYSTIISSSCWALCAQVRIIHDDRAIAIHSHIKPHTHTFYNVQKEIKSKTETSAKRIGIENETESCTESFGIEKERGAHTKKRNGFDKCVKLPNRKTQAQTLNLQQISMDNIF